MTSRHLKLLALLCVFLACAVLAAPHNPPPSYPYVQSHATPTPDTSRLAEGVQLQRFYATAAWNDAAKAAKEKEASLAASRPVRYASGSSVYGSGACGGDLPPCSVLACESGGNLTAQNPRSTASGKWQILDSTWAGYGGYPRAMYAPEEVQDAKARQLYAGGRGRGQWVC